MFKDVSDIKELLVPSVLGIAMFYCLFTGQDYARDIIVAFIAVMTNKAVTNK